jgi:hypothetical protein
VPGSLALAAFVLGAILLLLALVGGGIKLFGAEVPGKVGKAGRVFALAGGAVLIAFALLHDLPRTQDRQEPAKVTPPAQPAPDPGPAGPAPVAQLGGIWHDAAGTVYQIDQRGNSFTFTSYNPNGLRAQGSGTIDGSHFETVFQTNVPSTGHCSGTVLPGGRQTQTSCSDSVYGNSSAAGFR